MEAENKMNVSTKEDPDVMEVDRPEAEMQPSSIPKVFVLPKVAHQVARILVDVEAKTIVGRTDLFVSAREICKEEVAGVRLHCPRSSSFVVERVTVNGEESTFTYAAVSSGRHKFDYGVETDKRKESLHSRGLTRLADECWAKYNKRLEEDMDPRLIIDLPKNVAPQQATKPSGGVEGEVGESKSAEDGGVICLSIDYVVRASEGQALVFEDGGFCFTQSHPMPTMSWLPCVEGRLTDLGSWRREAYPVSLEIRARSTLAATCSGTLISAESGDEGGDFRSHRFVTTAMCQVSALCFVVGPLSCLDKDNFTIEREDPTKRKSDPQQDNHEEREVAPCEVKFFASGAYREEVAEISTFLKLVFAEYRAYLGSAFPLAQISVCLLPPGLLWDPIVSKFGVVLVSLEAWVSDHVRKLSSIECKTRLARAVADQWFGNIVTAKSVEDSWLVSGLAGLLTAKVVAKFFGENEAAYQASRKMAAVVGDQNEGSTSLLQMIQLAPLMEAYASTKVLTFKADLLVWMMETRIGAEPFQKVLQDFLRSAIARARSDVPSAAAADAKESPSALTLDSFFAKASKTIDAGVDNKWLQGFNERWVVGRGIPHLIVAFCYNKKQHTITVAIKQKGLKAANVSGTASVKCCGKEGSGLGMVTLVTGETDGVHKSNVFVGDQALVLEDVKCHGKLATKKRKRKKDEEAAAMEDNPAEENLENSSENCPCGPVKWLHVHHNHEWLASFQVSQTERMWINQLESSKNITFQLQAINGLVALDKVTYSTVNALNTCARNKQTYHRVRSEAALALAKTAGESTNWAGINTLLNLYREAFFNPDTQEAGAERSEAANKGPMDAADQLVSHATGVAIGMLRDEDGHAPQEASDFLLELLRLAPHDTVTFSANERTVYLLKGVGLLALDAVERLEAALGAIEVCLQRDKIFTSPQMMITCAGLQSTCSLLLEHHRRYPEADCRLLDRSLFLLRTYTLRHLPHNVRSVAHVCMIMLESLRHGSKLGFQALIEVVEEEASSRVKADVIAAAKDPLVVFRRSMHEPLNTGDMYDLLDFVLAPEMPVQVTYKIFELLQQLGRRPVCLHRASDEDLHREFCARVQEEQRAMATLAQARPVITDMGRMASRPTKKTVVLQDPTIDAPPSPSLQSYTTESGHTFQVGQRIRGKWRNGSQWYGGSINRIHANGRFDIRYDDGDLEKDVGIDRVIPEGGWQFTSATAQELVTNSKKQTYGGTKQSKQSGDPDAKVSLPEPPKEKVLSEEEKKQKLVEELMRLASKILNGIRSARAARYFMKPVDVSSFGGESQEQKERALNEYLKVIGGKPMDLGTITDRARGGKYTSPLDFRDDMRQIFINSRKFNSDHPESVVYMSGEKLSEAFESKWKESGIEELWEAGEIRPLIHRVESRAHASAMGGHGSADPLYKRGQKVTFEDERTQKMWSSCLLVLKDVKTHAKAWPFLKPVNPVSDNAPNYFDIVKTPMDLATITDKLASRVYPNVAAFKSDMELVFENCRLYNKTENVVKKAGEELEAFFKVSWAKHDVDATAKLMSKDKKVLTREDEMMKECDRIVHFLKKHKHAQAFLRPVTAESLQNSELWAKYQDVIDTPMDISTIANKQRKRKYETIDDFKSDVNLVFENCFKFNFPGDPVHKAGQQLKSGFKRRWRKLEEKFGIERLPPSAEAWKRVSALVQEIFANDLSISFRAPVDKISVPDYYDVIQQPIDLATIRAKVQTKEYASPADVKADMDLLFANCKQYNKEGDPVTQRGDKLRVVFQDLWTKANIDSLLAETTWISGDDSLGGATLSDGAVLPENTILTTDSGLTQDTSRHHAEVVSKEKPLPQDHQGPSPAKNEGPGEAEAEAGANGQPEAMDVDGTSPPSYNPGEATGGPKIKLKHVPPMKKIFPDSDDEAKAPDRPPPRPQQDLISQDANFSPNSSAQQDCIKMLFFLKKNKSASDFLHPVTSSTFADPTLWQKYQQIVQNPMDLTAIHEGLKSSVYKTPSMVWQSVTQIFENCYKFNYAVDPVYKKAKELQKIFMKRWLSFEKKFALVPQERSDLDQIWISMETFVAELIDDENGVSLRAKMGEAGAIGFDFKPITDKLQRREYADPVQVRDEFRFQFRSLLTEVEGTEDLQAKAQAFFDKFQSLWSSREFERRLSRCVIKTDSPAKMERSRSTRDVQSTYGSDHGNRAAAASAEDAAGAKGKAGSSLTLKIKFGAPKS